MHIPYMESVDRAFCTTPLIGRRLLPASHKPFLQTSGLPVPSMPYTHVCDVVLLRLHLRNVYSSILKKVVVNGIYLKIVRTR